MVRNDPNDSQSEIDMNVAQAVRDHVARKPDLNTTRAKHWLTAHIALSDCVTHTPNASTSFAAQFEVKCTCCGQMFNGTMIDLDHVNNDGHMDLHTDGKKLCGSKLYAAWFNTVARDGRTYRFDLRSCCKNCNGSKNENGGECMCQAAQHRRLA